MKKSIFSKLFLSMLFVSLSFAVSSCSDDDEPKPQDNYTTEYTFEAEFSDDFLKTADIKAYIISPDGTM